MIIVTYLLFSLTITALLIWLVDQLFLGSYKNFDSPNKSNFMSLLYQALPYLLLLSVICLILMLRQGLDFDFNYILLPVTCFLFLVIVLDKVIYHDRKTFGKKHERSLIANAYEFFPILAIVLIVRSFIIEPFNIPSPSMVPTLYTGDFIVVNKYDYGVRLPLINKKVIDIGEPEHGDVAVFRYPKNPRMHYIKRVIGLPGDIVSYQNGVLSVNGQPLDKQPSDFTPSDELIKQIYKAGQESVVVKGKILDKKTAPLEGVEEEKNAIYYQETQGKHRHLVRYLHDFKQDKNLNVSWQVPEGQYFFMGDNRDRSYDSRFWGFVPEENLVGKAVYVWTHKQPGFNLPTFSRNGRIN